MKAEHPLRRQGDVLIIAPGTPRFDGAVRPVQRPASAAIEVERDAHDRVVLAEGEVTGHAHAIHADGARLLESDAAEEQDERWLALDAPVDLVHEEHYTIPLVETDLIIRRKREYAPERPIWVAD